LKEKDEQKCELCQIEQENMEHFLLRCPALNEKRKTTLSKLKQTLIQWEREHLLMVSESRFEALNGGSANYIFLQVVPL
jgi:hypothetical protein